MVLFLRYHKDKEKVAGYPYEPWHIRYVGESFAKYLETKHYTMEDYYYHQNSGILLINKEKDYTSRDVVNIVSKTLGIKKIGHTGTLDPLATGLLVLTVGDATKIGSLLTAIDKEYIATFTLGILTDTLDITGKVVKRKRYSSRYRYERSFKIFY